MKLGFLFGFLVYYALLLIFYSQAYPYMDEGFTTNVEFGDIGYRTGYVILTPYEEDFNSWDFIQWYFFDGWYLVYNDGHCVDDDNDDCFISPADENASTYTTKDIDLTLCKDSEEIIIQAYISTEGVTGYNALILQVSDDSEAPDTSIGIFANNTMNGTRQMNISSDYAVDAFRLGFYALINDAGSFYIDDVSVSCYVDDDYLSEEAEVDTSIGIGDFLLFAGFGIGLPDDTPSWFTYTFAVWQSIITILFMAFLYQAIRGS